jgi:hypothetical protein
MYRNTVYRGPSVRELAWRVCGVTIPRRLLGTQAPLALDGMPAIGSPPAAARGATFPTAYFGRRQDALDWLAS